MARLSYGGNLASFIKGKLRRHIEKDLRNCLLFTEGDLHAVVYYHLRKTIRDRPNWYVRCKMQLEKGKKGYKPDIVIFNRYCPKYVLELKFLINENFPNFPKSRLLEDYKKLKSIVNSNQSLGKACLIAVFDADPGKVKSFKKDEKWEKYRYEEILINAQEIRGYNKWINKWITIKSKQK